MGNPLNRFGVSDAEIAAAIAADGQVNAALNEHMEKVVVPYAQSISPVDDGDYAAGWHVAKKARRGKGIVGNKHWKAHMIEFGTKADPQDSKSPFGPDTPTPAFAVGQKVAEHFGGNLTGDGIEVL